ncbi:MAG: SRPBCC family protein [Halioglobus sp.]
MVAVVVEKEIPLPAEKVWGLLADFGDISWSGMENVEVEGEGVGMIRKIIVGEGKAAVERLEAYDANNMTFTYSIVSGNPMPIENIQGSPQVTVVDDGHCTLSWTVTGNEVGIPESEAAQMLKGFYAGLLETIAGAAATQE